MSKVVITCGSLFEPVAGPAQQDHLFEVQGLTVEGDWQPIIGTTGKAKCLAISDRLYGHPKYLRLRVIESHFDPETNRHIRRVISLRDHSILMFFGPVFRAAVHSAWLEPKGIWKSLLRTFRRFVSRKPSPSQWGAKT